MGRYIAFFSTTLPPIFSHSPFGTYFHSSAALSVLAWPAQECLPVAQSFWPAGCRRLKQWRWSSDSCVFSGVVVVRYSGINRNRGPGDPTLYFVSAPIEGCSSTRPASATVCFSATGRLRGFSLKTSLLSDN